MMQCGENVTVQESRDVKCLRMQWPATVANRGNTALPAVFWPGESCADTGEIACQRTAAVFCMPCVVLPEQTAGENG